MLNAVLLVGPQTQNKTNFAHIKYPTYFHFTTDENKLGYASQTELLDNKALNNQNIVINLPNATISERKRFIDVLRKNKYFVTGSYISRKENELSQEYTSFIQNFDRPNPNEGFSLVNHADVSNYSNAEYCNKALFFDFDAICSYDPYEKDITKSVSILQNVEPQFKIYKSHNFKLIGLSNGLMVTRNKITSSQNFDLIEKVFSMLRIHVDDMYLDTRPEYIKPNPAFAFCAQKKHKLDLSKSFMIGFDSSDVLFAYHAEIKNYFLNQKFFSQQQLASNYKLLKDYAEEKHRHILKKSRVRTVRALNEIL